MLSRQLLYTSLSRAEKTAIIIGDEKVPSANLVLSLRLLLGFVYMCEDYEAITMEMFACSSFTLRAVGGRV